MESASRSLFLSALDDPLVRISFILIMARAFLEAKTSWVSSSGITGMTPAKLCERGQRVTSAK